MQVGQGSLISVPVPPHLWHGWEIENRPCDSASTPRPLQALQTVGEVPGLAPVPWQVVQGADSATLTGTCAPSIACSKEMCTSVSRSRPRCGRPAGAAGTGAAAEQVGEDVAEARRGKPPRNAPGSKPPPKIPPPVSYARRFSGSERTE